MIDFLLNKHKKLLVNKLFNLVYLIIS